MLKHFGATFVYLKMRGTMQIHNGIIFSGLFSYFSIWKYIFLMSVAYALKGQGGTFPSS